MYFNSGVGELLGSLVALQGLPGLIGIVGYVFLALGLYAIAQRRGLPNPWLAWIPVANVWLLGSISDQYQQVTRNRSTRRRTVLLWLEIAMVVLTIVFFVVLIGFIMDAAFTEPVFNHHDFISYEDDYYEYYGDMDTQYFRLFMEFGASMVGIGLVMTVLYVVYLVFLFIAYYDLFVSCDPEHATLFLVLSIVFSFAIPFFVFAVRNRDDGMRPPVPPQWGQPGQYPPSQPQYQPSQPQYQPWQNAAQNQQPPVQQYQPPVQQPVQTWQQPPVQQPVQQPPVIPPVHQMPPLTPPQNPTNDNNQT